LLSNRFAFFQSDVQGIEDNVVIIDEAYNLPDAMDIIHSNKISENQVYLI
jgi:Rad3-related DNA helicase